MKRESSKKIVTIEEHSLILDSNDLMHALEADDPSRVIDNPELKAVLYVGEDAVAPSQLVTMLRTMNPDIPESATLCLAITWQEQVEIDPAQMQVPAAPQYQQPPPYQPQPPQFQQPQFQQPPQQQYPQQPPPTQCRTCGAVPDIQGPTPECMDVVGCGRVLREKGMLLPPRAVPPPGAPNVGIGSGAGAPPGVLVNRDTGEKAFADKNGAPYGKHEDYQTR